VENSSQGGSFVCFAITQKGCTVHMIAELEVDGIEEAPLIIFY